MSNFYPYFCALNLIGGASNIVQGSNPAYLNTDFFAVYPQFQGVVDATIVDMFISMATNTVLQVRWHDNWAFGMALYVAHFCTLYLQSMGNVDSPTAGQVTAAAQARGLQTSKSVGDVSVSYDFGAMSEEFKGWGNMALTQYGQTFITLAKPLGRAGSYVW